MNNDVALKEEGANKKNHTRKWIEAYFILQIILIIASIYFFSTMHGRFLDMRAILAISSLLIASPLAILAIAITMWFGVPFITLGSIACVGGILAYNILVLYRNDLKGLKFVHEFILINIILLGLLGVLIVLAMIIDFEKEFLILFISWGLSWFVSSMMLNKISKHLKSFKE